MVKKYTDCPKCHYPIHYIGVKRFSLISKKIEIMCTNPSCKNYYEIKFIDGRGSEAYKWFEPKEYNARYN